MPIASEVSIYIKRADLIMGPFSESQTVQRYHRGEFRDSDLAMIDGMTGWHPLATYIVDETDDAPSSFDASAPPPIPQNEPPPRFDLGEEPVPERHEEPRLDERMSRFEFANPVGAAWALLSLGVVVMILSRWPVLLWIPLILAAIALAVQQLVRRNYVHAGPLLAVALLAPWFVWSQWLSPAKPHVVPPVALATPVRATPAPVIVPPVPAAAPPKVVVEKPEANPPPAVAAPEPEPEPPALVSAPPKFVKGEFVTLTTDTKLRFDGKEFRTGKAGERFEVLAAAADKVYLKAKTPRGQVIAITAPPDQLKLAPPPMPTPVRPHIIE
jgi:hypothetical protein